MRGRLAMATGMMVICLACIHVVVNVYFPESEAKGALATLEDELLKGGPEQEPPQPEATPAPEAQPDQAPSPTKESRLFTLFRPRVAYAAAPVTEKEIYNRIKAMPKVLEAYHRMAARLRRVNHLRRSGVAGEGNDGLLHPRKEVIKRKAERTIADENADRSIVIRGLAKAALLAQGISPSEDEIQRVLPDAAATFAALRLSKAEPGWWVQRPNGAWKQK